MLMSLIALFPVVTLAQDACEPSGVEFGFFNGVQTTEDHAKLALFEIEFRDLYGHTTPNGEPITYALYFNDSEGLSDFVETFDQRLQEQNGLLAGRFELFFSAIKGEGGWWEALTGAVPALKGLLSGLADTFRATLIRDLTADVGRPDTFKVAQRHREQIAHAVAMEKKLLLFAHSQGNLFVNAAYDHAVGLSDPKAVRVVHVAPASPRATGPHSLADLDLVINGLRLVGSVLPVSDSMVGYALRPPGLNGERDGLGHGLLEIYLNAALPMAGRIRDQVLTALRELESPPKKPWADYPDFVSNSWTGGEQPEPIYDVVPPSHSLDKIVSVSSAPTVWKRYRSTSYRGGTSFVSTYWAAAPFGGSPDQGWSSSTYSGRNVRGTSECTWGRGRSPQWPSEPWSVCRAHRVPYYIPLGPPDELLALGDVEPGTLISLYTQTYTRLNLLLRYRPPVALGEGGSTEIDFYSFASESWVGLSAGELFSEKFVGHKSQLLNGSSIEAWQRALSEFDSAEQNRYGWYLQRRSEYEERRKLCEVVPSPPPPPPSSPRPIPEVCNPAESDLCVS